MNFSLAPKDLDRVGPIPLYRQLADRFQQAITAGELVPGDALPSEKEIEATLGVSRPVIRTAMDELLRAGLIVKRSGAATRVAEKPRRRVMDTSRYVRELELLDSGEPHPETSAFADEHAAEWSQVSIDADYRREKATPADAELLGIDVGAPIIRRVMIKYVDGKPMQLQRSAVPLSIAKGTVLEDPDVQPYPGGTIAELYAAGHRVTRVIEEAWARMPTGDERRQLQQVAPGPVWDIVRTFCAGEQAVEVSRVVTPTASNVLRYETDLS
jgi:GntR family transcriptional regulator